MRSALLSVVFAALSLALIVTEVGSWENSHYARTIDLSRGFVKETDLIQITNTGDNSESTYYFTLNDGVDSIDQLSVVSISLDGVSLEVNPTDAGYYQVNFPEAIAPGSSGELRVNYVYLSGLDPVPEKIDLADTQKLVVKLNKMPYSPYVTKEYSLRFIGVAKGQEVEIPDERATGAPEMQPRVEEQALVYGPTIEEIDAFSIAPFGLQYEHQKPLTTVENLHRGVWIPAAADVVQFEEYYEVTNRGAELSKGFSRVDWMAGRYDVARTHFSIRQFEYALGDTNFDDYYFTDKVGMVSTHQIIQNFLLLQPRYPIFGDWHYNFTLGWNQPIGKNVHHVEGDTYIARAPLLNQMRDVTYNNVYLSFYLPEGAEFVNISAPIEFEKVDIDQEFSFLDVSEGRTKVTLKFENLFDDLSRIDAFIMYKLPTTSVYKKVVKIAAYTFAGLFSYYLLQLLDLGV